MPHQTWHSVSVVQQYKAGQLKKEDAKKRKHQPSMSDANVVTKQDQQSQVNLEGGGDKVIPTHHPRNLDDSVQDQLDILPDSRNGFAQILALPLVLNSQTKDLSVLSDSDILQHIQVEARKASRHHSNSLIY